MNAEPFIAAEALTRVYQRGRDPVRALDNVSFELHTGEFLAVVGPSGSGKTTLLNLLGCLDTPTSGTLRLQGRPIHALPEIAKTRLRRDKIGFIFQNFALLPTLTVAENIALPALFAGRKAARRAEQLLLKVELSHRASHFPRELSGGEMQRAAIARALINEPALLLADEPTGNLDRASGDRVIDLLSGLHRDGLTIVVVTHNQILANASARRMELREGRLVQA